MEESGVERSGEYERIPSPYEITAEKRAGMFRTALDKWRDYFHRHKGDLRSGEDMKAVKKSRKIGGKLRTAYILFDRRHEVPDAHRRLMFTTGEYKDFDELDEKGSKRNIRKAVAGHSPDEFDFLPATDEEYHSELNTRIDKVVSSLPDERLDSEHFHRVRKLMRHLMFLYKMLVIESGSNPAIDELIEKLKVLNKSLGDQHNDNITILDGKLVYKEPETEFREDDKHAIRDVFNMMGIAVPE